MKGLTAVIFGAGKMACGLLGQLLSRSGYRILFVARRPEVVDAINRRRGYTLLVTGEGIDRVKIGNCAALSLDDRERVAEETAGADVVFTAVGIDNLPAVTPVIAEGLWRRSRLRGESPGNIVACENLPGAGAYLRHQVVGAACCRSALMVERIGGFSAALTRRIMTGGLEGSEMTFTVDADYDLIIDTHGLKGEFPKLAGATLTEEFPAMVMRKLYTLNCAHAVAAYLGFREGCDYIHEAAAHPRVAPVVRGAVAEAQAALKAEFPRQAEGIDRDAADALERITNARLADPVRRVARGPRRKLSPRERLVGAARLAIRHRLPSEHLCRGIAAALAYDNPDDPQAVALQKIIAEGGLERALTEECGLLPHEELALSIKRQWLDLVGRTAADSLAAVGSCFSAPTSLEEIVRLLMIDLSRRYDPRRVEEVLGRVAEEFREARIWSFVPILLERRVSQALSGRIEDGAATRRKSGEKGPVTKRMNR